MRARIALGFHPLLQVSTHRLQNRFQFGLLGQIVQLMRVAVRVIQFLGRMVLNKIEQPRCALIRGPLL